MSRTATIDRKTTETAVRLVVELDGAGVAQVATGVGFLDHMLNLFARHGRFDLKVEAKGDRHVDDHHTVEDVGICLGLGLAKALGDKAGIHRYGHFTLPMDESLAKVGIDLSGRPACVWKVPLPAAKVGSFDVELAEEFWRGVANHGGINYHAVLHYGSNTHHILEAVFKASGRALRQAVAIDPGLGGAIPSTKGVL